MKVKGITIKDSLRIPRKHHRILTALMVRIRRWDYRSLIARRIKDRARGRNTAIIDYSITQHRAQCIRATRNALRRLCRLCAPYTDKSYREMTATLSIGEAEKLIEKIIRKALPEYADEYAKQFEKKA